MHECHIKWDSTTCDMQFNESNLIMNLYDDHNILRFFEILNSYEALSFECKPILWNFFEYAYMKNNIVEYFKIDIEKFIDFIYPYILKYYNNNHDKPTTIIIGKLLQQLVVDKNLPPNRMVFTIKDFYKILYIPEFSGVLILNKVESALINAE